MTDLTNEFPQMSTEPKRHWNSKGEYRLYLGLIFLAAVPICTAIWAYTLVKKSKLPAQGPIQSALSEARTITPRIFWA